MARTDTKGSAVGLEVARESAQLAAVGAGKGLFAPDDLKWIFKTVARACTDPRDQWLYLAKCNAHGLSPLKGELFAIARKGKDGSTTVTYVTSYHVFVSRARRAGFVLRGEIVCKGDDFVMDAVSGKPMKHTYKADPGRGKNASEILGAWAGAFDEKGECVTGKFWPTHELLIEGGYNPLKDKIPGHFAWKTAICRVGRLVAPDLSSLYGAEEFGFAIPGPSDRAAPKGAELTEVVPADPVAALEAQGAMGDLKPSAQAAGAVEDVVPIDPRLSFPERAALVKELAMRGMTKEAEALDFIAKVLGARPEGGTKTITRSERDKIVAALPALRSPKEGGA